MIHPWPRVFLSYSSKDRDEVQALATELRRRGVPLWWDTTDLPRGRSTEKSLAEAAKAAAGFAFYLTENAARSAWVRETERRYALDNLREDRTFGIFPIFRDDRRAVTKLLQDLAEGSDRSAYDLSDYHGSIVQVDPANGAPTDEELGNVAGGVLRQLLLTLAERSPGVPALRIGARTRGGPALKSQPLDLLVDWTQDYPDQEGRGEFPSPVTLERLWAALSSIRAATGHEWRGNRIRIVPQCHLSMALAIGFLFRRNSGMVLEVVNPYDSTTWEGPHEPEPVLNDWWADPSAAEKDIGRGEDLAISIGISQPVRPGADAFIEHRALSVAKRIDFEPAAGPGKRSMERLTGTEAHRAAQAVVESISRQRSEGVRGTVHLFLAGPAPFAVLLAQHLSNLGAIQTYEWKDNEQTYTPMFLLGSS